MFTNDEGKATSVSLKTLMDHIPYGLIAIDQFKKISAINKQATAMLGYLDTNMIGLDLRECIENLEDPELTLSRILTKKNLCRFDLSHVRSGNSHLILKGRPIDEGMIITMADITAIREMEAEALTTLLEGQELERRRIAMEIHDGIGPLMSALKMNLGSIESELAPLEHQIQKRFDNSNKIIDDAAQDLRSISHNLIPRALFDFGLVDALTSLLEKIKYSTSTEVKLIVTGFDQRFDEVKELGLYRICQELISNSMKHAKAKNITIQLTKKNSRVLLMYEDDGQGFDPAKATDGIGLLNIRNRAKAFAGEAIIDSHPGKGITATIEIPVN